MHPSLLQSTRTTIVIQWVCGSHFTSDWLVHCLLIKTQTLQPCVYRITRNYYRRINFLLHFAVSLPPQRQPHTLSAPTSSNCNNRSHVTTTYSDDDDDNDRPTQFNFHFIESINYNKINQHSKNSLHSYTRLLFLPGPS